MDLTLFKIEDELAQLIEHRAQRVADLEEPASAEELSALDQVINEYELAAPAKVTGVVAMFRKWKAQRANIASEILRLTAIDKFLDACERRLKERAAAALELLPMPKKGARTLTGVDGSRLMLKGNGGVEPLQVDGWDADAWRWLTDVVVLPDEFQKVEVTMSLNDWNLICKQIDHFVALKPVFAEPDTKLIRETLGQDCGDCYGTGSIPKIPMEKVDCPTCGGTGKRTIPGARLNPRGQHVEIK